MASPDVLSSRATKTTIQWVNLLKRWSENDDCPAFGGGGVINPLENLLEAVEAMNILSLKLISTFTQN